MAEPTQQIVVITGISGAGRRTAAHTMEDLGWYVVDNLPPALLPALAAQIWNFGNPRLAVVVDARTRESFEQIPEVFAEIKRRGIALSTLFLEANDDVIVQRQESNRRPVPLQGDGRLLEGIARERRMLAELRGQADIVVDTSRLSARQLATRIANHFGTDESDELLVSLMSFGFKNGTPIDADMVFDVRFLPNPYWIPDLRPKTGLSPDVAAYVMRQPAAPEFLDTVLNLLAIIRPGYLAEAKRQVTVAIGCTGGKHRSTAISEALASRLRAQQQPVSVLHRDLGKE